MHSINKLKVNQIKSVLLFIIVSLFLSACVSYTSPTTYSLEQTFQPEAPVPYHQQFGLKPQFESAQNLFELTPQQKRDFLDFFSNYQTQGFSGHEIVAKYLNQFISDFNYHSETLTARESLRQRHGNCLSLAILTTAIARLAKVEVGYQLMHTRPVFMQKENTIFTAQHVRSLLFDPDFIKKKNTILFMSPLIYVDYFPTRGTSLDRMVSEEEFISMYYRNKAADAIAQNNYRLAYWLAQESFIYAPNNGHAINMIALAYDRLNLDRQAEQLYQYGIEHSHNKLELLSNYKNYLLRNQKAAQANMVAEKIKEIDIPNPFEWLKLADKALSNKDLNTARRYYDRVISLAPYLYHGYAGVAKVEFLKGNTNKAILAIKEAQKLSVDRQTSSLLDAKMSALNSYKTYH